MIPPIRTISFIFAKNWLSVSYAPSIFVREPVASTDISPGYFAAISARYTAASLARSLLDAAPLFTGISARPRSLIISRVVSYTTSSLLLPYVVVIPQSCASGSPSR